MPDPQLILKAIITAAALAAVIVLVCGRPWRNPSPVRVRSGWVLGVCLGFYSGCLLLRGHGWKAPLEDQDRLLFAVLMAAEIEFFAGIPSLPRWMAILYELRWLGRAIVVAATAPILLGNTIYLADLAGPNSREWGLFEAFFILAGLSAALASVWVLLDKLAAKSPGLSIPLVLAGTSGGAAVVIMLSGYATGGQLGFALAGALTGAAAASLFLNGPAEARGAVGVGLVGLFGLLVIGRYFGTLSNLHAALLFFGPLLCWVPEMACFRRLGPRLRGLLRVPLAAAPAVLAVMLAQQQFVVDSTRGSSEAIEPTIEDYSNFGK